MHTLSLQDALPISDKLLIKGFFNEVINNSKWDIVHDKVSEIIDRKYMNLIGRKNG